MLVWHVDPPQNCLLLFVCFYATTLLFANAKLMYIYLGKVSQLQQSLSTATLSAVGCSVLSQHSNIVSLYY